MKKVEAAKNLCPQVPIVKQFHLCLSLYLDKLLQLCRVPVSLLQRFLFYFQPYLIVFNSFISLNTFVDILTLYDIHNQPLLDIVVFLQLSSIALVFFSQNFLEEMALSSTSSTPFPSPCFNKCFFDDCFPVQFTNYFSSTLFLYMMSSNVPAFSQCSDMALCNPLL